MHGLIVLNVPSSCWGHVVFCACSWPMAHLLKGPEVGKKGQVGRGASEVHGNCLNLSLMPQWKPCFLSSTNL